MLAFLLLVSIPAAPIFVFIFLYKCRHRVVDKKFKMKFQSMYHALDLKNKYFILVTPMFLIRRLIFAFSIVYMADYTVFQILVNIMFSLFYLCFLIQIRPMNKKYLNILEIINETTLLTLFYLCLLFTEFVDSVDIRYMIGWVFVALTASNLIIGLGALV